MRQVIMSFFILINSLVSFSQQDNTDTGIVLTYDAFKEHLKNTTVQLVDLRTDEEYKNGFIPNAVQMNFYKQKKILTQIKALKKDKPVYLYCHSGVRSAKASKILLNKGFATVYDFSGGYSSWVKNNNSITSAIKSIE